MKHGLPLVGAVILLFLLYLLSVFLLYRRTNKRRIAVILTMYTDGKQDMYTKNVNRWLAESNVDIYTVDSANQGVPIQHPRLHQTIFKQEGQNQSGTHYEVQSLNKVYQQYKKQLEKYDYVFKITGKYVVPQLVDHLPYRSYDLIFQSRCNENIRWQNSELFGVKGSRLGEILGAISEYDREKQLLFEHILYELSSKYTYVRLPPLYLDQRIPRADGLALDSL